MYELRDTKRKISATKWKDGVAGIRWAGLVRERRGLKGKEGGMEQMKGAHIYYYEET
jgi:hypothetical protein